MNKLKNFTKKYGFYLAVGVISVSAIGAAIVLSNNSAEVDSKNGAYVEEVAGQDEEVSLEDTTNVDLTADDLEADTSEVVEDVTVDAKAEEEVSVEDAATTDEEELVAETFSSTTADAEEAPAFADGDTMVWPVSGDVIVPFKDDNTNHWYSTALEQTMRTYGICISAEEGDSIKAPAKGVIVDIIDDATSLESMKLVGNVGQVIIIDHGNGYTSEFGIQGGKADKDLLGQTVDAMQVIGEAGSAMGPFADLESNVYMRVKHNDEYVDPTTILGYREDVAGIDMGHVAD